MPHPRPTAGDDALSSLLRAGTDQIHKEAERRPFMRIFFAGRLPKDAYVAWLARLWHLYGTLETALDAIPPERPEAGLIPLALYRTDRIEADLDHLTSGEWRSHEHVTPATRDYIRRIESAVALPAGLIVHAWLRYMGNVGGRDTLRRLSAAAIGAGADQSEGLAFTDYSALGVIGAFFAEFHAKLDALPLTIGEKDAALAEAEAGFRLNIALTDELAQDFRLASDLETTG